MADHPFTADDLVNMQYGTLPDGWRIAPFGDTRITDHSRWTVGKQCIVTDGEHYYSISWDVGATEYQETGYETYVMQVYPHEVTITEYRSKP